MPKAGKNAVRTVLLLMLVFIITAGFMTAYATPTEDDDTSGTGTTDTDPPPPDTQDPPPTDTQDPPPPDTQDPPPDTQDPPPATQDPPPATEQPAATEPQETEPPDEDEDEEETTGNILIFVVGGVVLLSLIAAVAVIASSVGKRKAETVHVDVNQYPQQPPPPPQPPPLPPQPTYVRPVYTKPFPVVVPTYPRYPHAPISVGVAHHIGTRESQQDSFCVSDISNEELFGRKGLLAVVADGMGSLAEGSEISAIVTRSMLQYYDEVATFNQPEMDLLSMMNAANENVKNYLIGKEPGGSTVVAVNLHGDKLYWLTVGNSHLYLARNGTLMQLNRDHTYAVDLDEKAAAGEITWEEAQNHPRRAGLTSYLGMSEPSRIDRDAHPMQMINGDTIILVTDGISNALSDNEIIEALRYSPHESAAKLQEMTLAKHNPKQDNLTAIVIQYH